MRKFELRNASGKDEGIFATQPFEAGETVMVGVIREVLDGNHSHASQIDHNTYVFHDGFVPKVNHSCEPNCGIHINATGAHDFVAMRDIMVGEEITFDYAMRNYSIDHFDRPCQCGSEKCRGTITGWKDLPETTKQKYEGFVAPYLLELDKQNKELKAGCQLSDS